tara:strand:+ start:203 stop:448 length:246 start_codon:yes stop_codon:yes gene_type:complete
MEYVKSVAEALYYINNIYEGINVENDDDLDNCVIAWNGTPEISKEDIKTAMDNLKQQWDNRKAEAEWAGEEFDGSKKFYEG